MTMKQLLPYLFATFVVLPQACGSKSDASSASPGASSEQADPVTTAPRTGKIDPNAMRRPQNAPGSDGSAATSPAPSLPADESMKAKLDTDGDGKISPEERLAARKARADSMRTKLDANGDGKLSPDELAKSDNVRGCFAGSATRRSSTPTAMVTSRRTSSASAWRRVATTAAWRATSPTARTAARSWLVMRAVRNLKLSISILFLVAACGGKKPPATTTTAGSGSAMAAEPVGSGSAIAAGSATTPEKPVETKPEEAKQPPPPPPAPEPDAFMKLSKDEKIKIMKSKVLPAMTKLFKAYDAKHFAKFGCKTCHGHGADEGGDFKMPNPDLPVLDFEAIKAGKQDPKMAKFMGDKVKPEMAKLLGLEPWDEQHPAGFGCHGCHNIKGM